MTRKIIWVLIILISLTALALVGRYFFFSDNPTPIDTTTPNNVSPFGVGDNTDITDPLSDGFSNGLTNGSTSEEFIQEDELAVSEAELFRISQTPVGGYIALERGDNTVVRYVNRATGHMYDVTLPTSDGTTELEQVRITNITLPKIYEAFFKKDGSSVLFRTLKDDSDIVENTIIDLSPPETTSTSTEDSFYSITSLPIREDLDSIAVGTNNSLFYISTRDSSIVSSTFDSAESKTLYRSPFADWRLITAGSRLLAYTKASVITPGYAYTVNTSNGSLNKILGPLNALTVVQNSSGNKALYSYVEGGETKLYSKDLKSNENTEILPTTLAEKCIWSSQNIDVVICGAPIDGLRTNEPDNWYLGTTQYSDRIWLIDTFENVTTVLVEPESTLNVMIDVYKPTLSPDEDYFIFINKTDLSLWVLKLPEF